MKSRERVITAVNHEEPDRVPIDLGERFSSIHLDVYKRLLDYLGLNNVEVKVKDRFMREVEPNIQILRRFKIDLVRVAPRLAEFKEFIDQTGRQSFIDEWGIKWSKVGAYYDITDNPLKNAWNIRDVEEYQWPNMKDLSVFRGLRKKVARLHRETEFALTAASVDASLFEMACWLRGFQNFIIDISLKPEIATAILDKELELFIEFYDNYLDSVGDFVHIVQFGDDYGTQQSLILSPSLFRKFIKPRLKKLYDFVKSKTDAKILHHSDGNIYPIIPDLIDVGVDILNPMQPSVKGMDLFKIKKEFGDKLIFHGGIDVQNVLPSFHPSGVEEEVKRIIKVLANGGGYILAPTHNIQPDTRPENIITMFDAALKWGTYPIHMSF